MRHRLSLRSYELLALIDENTAWEGDIRPGDKLIRYWVPRGFPQYLFCHKRMILVGGPGDASAIKALIKKRLVDPQPVADYSCSITEEGICALEDYREKYLYDASGHIRIDHAPAPAEDL